MLQKDQLFKLFNKYGYKYEYVFQNIAIDLLTEEATKYTAYEFFWDRGRIKDDFQMELDKIFNKECSANVQFFQLRSVDLPALFEESIQVSEVKKQDIKKAEAELSKVEVEVDTRLKSADYQKNVNINIAKGESEALIQQNMADVESFRKVQGQQNSSYKNFKAELALTNDQLIDFLKTKAIGKFNEKNLALNIDTPKRRSTNSKRLAGRKNHSNEGNASAHRLLRFKQLS